jgi:hypothetical protein
MRTTLAAGYGSIVQEHHTDSESDSDSDSSESVGAVVHGTDYEQPTPHTEPEHDRVRRRSFIEEEEDEEGSLSLEVQALPQKKEKKALVTWSSLPFKRQLAILTIARFSEPLVQSSLRVSL